MRLIEREGRSVLLSRLVSLVEVFEVMILAGVG